MLGFIPCIDEFTIAASKTVAGRVFLLILLTECTRIVPRVQVETFIKPFYVSKVLEECTEEMVCYN